MVLLLVIALLVITLAVILLVIALAVILLVIILAILMILRALGDIPVRLLALAVAAAIFLTAGVDLVDADLVADGGLGALWLLPVGLREAGLPATTIPLLNLSARLIVISALLLARPRALGLLPLGLRAARLPASTIPLLFLTAPLVVVGALLLARLRAVGDLPLGLLAGAEAAAVGLVAFVVVGLANLLLVPRALRLIVVIVLVGSGWGARLEGSVDARGTENDREDGRSREQQSAEELHTERPYR